VLQFDIPVLGSVKLVTALFFDLGVYLVVVGLVLDVLRSLGARVDVNLAEQRPLAVTPR
jgi:multicomponent Na+:H+ antiporter subunit A